MSKERHVDFSMFGSLPLEIYIETKDPKTGRWENHLQISSVEDPLPDGLTSETRYWVDDMYMIMIVQAEAFRGNGGDLGNIDRAATKMVVTILDKPARAPWTAFIMPPDVPFSLGTRSRVWAEQAWAELLRSSPANHPSRARISGWIQEDDEGAGKLSGT